ncbi:MAG: hypothetical protein ACJ790_08020 [Myxococcaceae bacterium]
MPPLLRRSLYAVVVLLYIVPFPYHPGLRSPNELCRLWQTRALVEYGTLDINRALMDYGRVGDLSVKDGKYYPSKAPLMSFADVPVYAVLRAIGGGQLYAVSELSLVYWSRFFLTVLPTLLMLIILRRFLGAYLPANVTDALVVSYALGTLAFSYSLLFMSHQSTAVLLFSSFYALWRCGRGDWKEWGYLVAGAFAGATVAAEYTGALGVAVLFVYAAITFLIHRSVPMSRRVIGLLRAAGLATLGALPFIAALASYHKAAFGNPFTTGYKFLNDAAYQGWHVGGFLGIRLPDVNALGLSYFSRLRGLFMLAPFLLLALPGTVLLFRKTRASTASGSMIDPRATADATASDRALFWLIVFLLAGYTYFTSSFAYDSWGWTTGPRHMTGLVPFLLLPVGLLLVELKKTARLQWMYGLAVGLCAASIVVTGLVTFVNYIPDDVSEPLFGLAAPLFRDGFFVPTVFRALGMAGGGALGTLPIVLVLVAAGGVVLLLTLSPGTAKGSPPIATGVAALVVVLLFVGLHASLARHDDHDVAATKFLQSVWLTPPGH